MRLLFIADGRSPIALNWISHFVESGHEVHLVSTFPCQQKLDLASLAKREEIVYTPGHRKGLKLDRTSPALMLLQRVRDEAHRFAIGFHRQRRTKRGFA